MEEQPVPRTSKASTAWGGNSRLPNLVSFYLQWHRVIGHTKKTIRGYEVELRQLVRFLEARGHTLDIADVSTFDILTFLEGMKERGLAPRTIKTRHRALSTFFKWAMEFEIVSSSPLERIPSPRVPRVRKPFLGEEAFARLLDLCPLNTFLGARRASTLWILATTGMRKAELAALMIEDVAWKTEGLRIRMGKGQKERSVLLHREAQRRLLPYLAFRNDEHPHLWVTEERTPLTEYGLTTDMRRLIVRAGLRGEVKDMFHIFRRTWAAQAVRQGIPRPYAQAIAGWATPTMMDQYVEAMQAEEGAREAFRDFRPFG